MPRARCSLIASLHGAQGKTAAARPRITELHSEAAGGVHGFAKAPGLPRLLGDQFPRDKFAGDIKSGDIE